VVGPDRTGHKAPLLLPKAPYSRGFVWFVTIVLDIAGHGKTRYQCYPGVTPGKHEMAQALTTRTVEAAKPGKVRKEIPDAIMPGLYLVLQVSGAKSWAVRFRSNGRPRKYTLGGYPAIDLKSARELASKVLRAAAEGRDPGSEKASARAAGLDTVDAIAEQFIARHCARKNRSSTATGTQRLLQQYVLPRWGGRLARDITRRDVIDLLDRIVDDGKPIRANRCLAAVRKMFNWCVERDILQATPVAGVKPPAKERPRHRVLEDCELRAVVAGGRSTRWIVRCIGQAVDPDRAAPR